MNIVRLGIALLFSVSISLQAAQVSATPDLDACHNAVEQLERQISTLDIACHHDGDCISVFRGGGTREHPITLVNEGVPKKEAPNLLRMHSKVTQACLGVSNSRKSTSTLPAICRAGHCIKDSGFAEVPSKEKTDLRRTTYAMFVCDDVSGTKLFLKFYSGRGSCADLRPGPVGIQISDRLLSNIGHAIPLELGGPTRAWRCDSKKDCIPVRGSVTLSAFHEGGVVSGRYYLRFPDGAETGIFENVLWCQPDKRSLCKSFR